MTHSRAVKGAGALDLNGVELLLLEVSARCACGEPLERGERAGFDAAKRELLCLWCLSDLQAGRPRPTHREARPDTTAPRWDTPTAALGPGPTAYFAPRPAPARTRRGSRRTGTATTLAILLALICLALLARPYLFPAAGSASATGAGPSGSGIGDLILGAPIAPVAPTGTASLWPPVPADARATPLARPPGQRSSSTAFEFMSTTPSGTPVAFDPCRPIHLVVNSEQAPRGADRLVREAAELVGGATGLVLTLDGETDEAPRAGRPPMDKARYGNRWSPVLVAWTDPSAIPALEGQVVGIGGPAMAPFRDASEMHYVSGAVHLDGPALSRILAGPGGRERARAIVMHELAHLVGLTHVGSPEELMHAQNVGQTAFGDGDLEGLRRLGSGPCFS